MSHNKHIIDNVNKDLEVLWLDGIQTRQEAKEYYLKLAEGWEDPNPAPVSYTHLTLPTTPYV